MKILVACEESQAVTIELRKLGHEAYSCDIVPCSGGHPEWHIQGDVLKVIGTDSEEYQYGFRPWVDFITMDGVYHSIKNKWDMIIAHPPCTYLSNAGARFLYPGGMKNGINQERYEKGLVAKKLFMALWSADCDKICIENPTPSKVYGLPKHTQVIQPYEYGHPFQKRTQLWLKGLKPLKPTNIVEERQSSKVAGNWFNKGGKDRQKNRSKTFPGIAKAMAEQWAGQV